MSRASLNSEAIRFNMGERFYLDTDLEWERMVRAGLIRTSEEMCRTHTERKKMNELEQVKKCIDNGHEFKVVEIDTNSGYPCLRPRFTLKCRCCGYTKKRDGTFLEKRAIKILRLRDVVKII